MSLDVRTPEIRTQMQVRVVMSGGQGALARALRRIDALGIQSHLSYPLHDKRIVLFLSESFEEVADALRHEGVQVETETVLTVCAPERPGMLGHLLDTLEAEGIEVGYCYSGSIRGELLVVLRTGDNPRAEDVLRNLFSAEVPEWPRKQLDKLPSHQPTYRSS